MAGVAVSNRVVWQSGIGRFAAACSAAATETVREAIDDGADLSRAFAPKRSGTLAASIKSEMLSSTAGHWIADAKHALPQETGARPHPLPARVTFYWDKVARMWMWPETYERMTGFPGADPISHPGNPPKPYLRPAYEIVMDRVMSIARRKYPG